MVIYSVYCTRSGIRTYAETTLIKFLSKEEDLPVAENEEQKFWELGLLGCKSAISLLHTVYYYYGKLFRLRGSEHCNIRPRLYGEKMSRARGSPS